MKIVNLLVPLTWHKELVEEEIMQMWNRSEISEEVNPLRGC